MRKSSAFDVSCFSYISQYTKRECNAPRSRSSIFSQDGAPVCCSTRVDWRDMTQLWEKPLWMTWKSRKMKSCEQETCSCMCPTIHYGILHDFTIYFWEVNGGYFILDRFASRMLLSNPCVFLWFVHHGLVFILPRTAPESQARRICLQGLPATTPLPHPVRGQCNLQFFVSPTPRHMLPDVTCIYFYLYISARGYSKSES